ncbi:MAG TPA: methyltransferase domain-containing protein [Burkholderiaceae bacterium]|nr:methyltransferase domain-containing protein [Burkholderiaceae bacterium]
MQMVQMPRRHPVSAGFHLAGFRDVDGSQDAGAYLAYLDSVGEVFRDVIRFGVEALQLHEGSAVLDVGCGHGASLPLLAQAVGASGRVAGIDASAAMVAAAQRRVAALGLAAEVRHGDAHELPFDDGVFDAARIDRVLMFLRDPRKALAEVKRVVRPGGRICVAEGDVGTHAIDADDVATTRTMLAALSDRSPHGWIGRRLRTMALDLGFVDVELQLVPILSTSYAEWNDRLGVESQAALAVTGGVVTAQSAASWLDDLRTRDAQGRFVATALLFVLTATRP